MVPQNDARGPPFGSSTRKRHVPLTPRSFLHTELSCPSWQVWIESYAFDRQVQMGGQSAARFGILSRDGSQLMVDVDEQQLEIEQRSDALQCNG